MTPRPVRTLLATFLVLGVVATGVPAQAQSSTHRVPSEIDAGGERDVTEDLGAFIQAVPDGSVIELGPDARYRVEGSLVLEDRKGLTIEGNGATIFAVTRGDSDRAHWVLAGGSNLTFRDLVVRGANRDAGTGREAYVASLEGQHGFRVEGTRGLELDRITVEDIHGDFVYLGRDADQEWSRDVWIHDSTFARSGRQGIAVTAGRDIIIERNLITDTARATIDVEPNSPAGWGAQNVHVLDNDVGRGRLKFVASHGNGPVDNIVISGNRLRGQTLAIDVRPPADQRRSNFFIIDNRSSAAAKGLGPLMRFFRIDGLVLRGNHQRVAPEDVSIELWDVCGSQIAENDFEGRVVIERYGEPCDAEPRVPEPPAIPAREAALGSGPAEPRTSETTPEPAREPAGSTSEPQVDPAALDSGTSLGESLWLVVGALAILGGLGGLIAFEVARRRRAGLAAEGRTGGGRCADRGHD